uniref:Uncharacterized protein n=1 Tax=Strongyloides papillosus TaxID=174720 RepID=A0A0N5BFQ9_STREA
METDSVAQHTYQLLCDIFDLESTTSIKDSFKLINHKLIQYQSDNIIKKPLIKKPLSDKEKQVLVSINNAMFEDYRTREALFKLRSQATLDSFRRSKAKHFKEENYDSLIKEHEAKGLPTIEKLDIFDILSASEDLLQIEKISSGKTSKSNDIATKKYVMEEKPKDRGGRMRV